MDKKTCTTCRGTGRTHELNDEEVVCDICEGTGEVPDRGSLDNPKD